MVMEDVESRFMDFLQPIRDLTKNWEVDVAAQLGEYLEELGQICISFDGGKTTMNFIEAALVIQGSASIYSKKVESLYSLVYQVLDFISNKSLLPDLASKSYSKPLETRRSRKPEKLLCGPQLMTHRPALVCGPQSSPDLEDCVQFWVPHFEKDAAKLEQGYED